MQPGAMLFSHLLNRKSFVTELGELDKFFLNSLQSFLPLAVSDVSFCPLLASKSILFVQLLNVSDFRPKTCNLSPKNLKMIHSGKDNPFCQLGALEGKLGSAPITFATRPQCSVPSPHGTYNQVVGRYTTQRIKGGTQFTCVRCPYRVRTLDFDLKDGNLRTQAARALNQHATQVHNQPMIISEPNVQFVWRS
jgi:hypothetical protein